MKEIKITIYNLIIMIIIAMSIIFLCSFSIANAKRKIDLKNYISEMEFIQEKVNLIRKEYTVWSEYDGNETGNFLTYIQSLGYINANTSSNMYINEFNTIIKSLNNENTMYWSMSADSILSNYCYFSIDSLKKDFNISNPKSEVIVNFYTGNIISKNGIKDVTNKIIYRQYDSQIGNKLTTSFFENELKTIAEVIENNGLSQRVKITFNKLEDSPNIEEVYYYADGNEIRKSCKEFQDYIYMRNENAIYFTINTTSKYFFLIKDSNHIEYPRCRA